MPTSKTVYPGRGPLASDIFRVGRIESRRPSGQALEAVEEQVEVLYYAAMVCGPGELTRIDKWWIGFCPLWSHPRNHRLVKTFEVDHEANRWSCSVCRKGGNAIALVKALTCCEDDVVAAHVLMSAFRIDYYAEGV